METTESLDAMKARMVARMSPGADGYNGTIEWLKLFVEQFDEKERFSTIEELFEDAGGHLGFDECYNDIVEAIFDEEMKKAGFDRGSDEWEEARDVFAEARCCGDLGENLQAFRDMDIQEFCNVHSIAFDAAARANVLDYQKYAEDLRNNAVNWAKGVAIECELLPEADVRSRAIAAFNIGLALGDVAASSEADSKFLERICVNFIRHHLTNYDRLMQAEERANSDDAATVLAERVFSAIRNSYPIFKKECARQLNRRKQDQQISVVRSTGPRF